MAFEKRTILPGSENVQRPGLVMAGSAPLDETIRVTLVLRRRNSEGLTQLIRGEGAVLSREEHARRFGAEESDIHLVEQFAHEYGLTVVESSPSKRHVVLTGTADEVHRAFGTGLVNYRNEKTGTLYRGREGTISIPSELQNVVTAVLGLDARPVAKPHFRKKPAAATSFTPQAVAALYNFPTGVKGTGQTVAIIELGGGYKPADLATYFKNMNLATPSVTAVSVDGGKNTPGSDADGEVMLDIEVVGAVANGAKIAVYFAPNTDQGFIDAITNAVHDTTRKPSVISISWGGPEDSWSQQSRNAMNAALQDAATLGITVTAASGDDGSTDGAGDGKLHVDFPASSPFILACGGTKLQGSGSTISSEVVWNEIAANEGATGGGVSNAFALPAYQQSAGVPKQPQTNFAGRGVPDVAGNADPATGYQVLVNGQKQVIGGTSAVAPLWAGLVALINQKLGKPVGFLNPKLYTATKSAFHDITSGNNDDSKLGYYSARTGWDPCTGLGTPNGTALLNAFSSSASGTSKRTAVEGSGPSHSPTAVWSGISDPQHEQITATLILRRSGEDNADDLLAGTAPALPEGEAAAITSASPEDIAQVTSFAAQHGLKVIEANPLARTVKVQGSADKMGIAFGVSLGYVSEGEEGKHLSHKEAVSIPQSLSNLITAVLGLDQRPVAKHHIGEH